MHKVFRHVFAQIAVSSSAPWQIWERVQIHFAGSDLLNRLVRNAKFLSGCVIVDFCAQEQPFHPVWRNGLSFAAWHNYQCRVRAEALVNGEEQIASAFADFLKLAAIHTGQVNNRSHLESFLAHLPSLHIVQIRSGVVGHFQVGDFFAAWANLAAKDQACRIVADNDLAVSHPGNLVGPAHLVEKSAGCFSDRGHLLWGL